MANLFSMFLKCVLVFLPSVMVREVSFQPNLSPPTRCANMPLRKQNRWNGMEWEKVKNTHQFSVSHHFPFNDIHLWMHLCIQPVYLLNSHPLTLLKFPFNQSPPE